MKQEEHNEYSAYVTFRNQRVAVNIRQYGYLWIVSCDELECAGESIKTPEEAMKFFFMRVEEFNECGQ